MAAKNMLFHLLNHLNNFPSAAGVACLTSRVTEYDEVTSSNELTSELFDAPGVQFFVLNSSTLISLIELPSKVLGEPPRARVLLRDMTGKYAWDATLLYQTQMQRSRQGTLYPGLAAEFDLEHQVVEDSSRRAIVFPDTGYVRRLKTVPRWSSGESVVARFLPSALSLNESSARASVVSETSFDSSEPSPTGRSGTAGQSNGVPNGNAPPASAQGSGFIGIGPSPEFVAWSERATMRRPSTVLQASPAALQTTTKSTFGVDMLDEALKYLGETSSECLHFAHVPLNVPYPTPESMQAQEDAFLAALHLQHSSEEEYLAQRASNPRPNMTPQPVQPKIPAEPISPFHHCRLLLSHLGLLTFENRRHFHLLRKNDALLRLLKALDTSGSRDYHKIGILYVAPGQEDEHSIYANVKGSKLYEDFLAGLGWEVNLATHRGFFGGLDPNLSTGRSTPFYGTSTMEVIFHVATRMIPVNGDTDMKIIKKRHIANDRVRIIWCEHYRDFRPEILRTKFDEATIVIYPLPNGLYRISILRKPEIPLFGPLFDGAVVDKKVLAPLVRETAINANRVIVSQVDGFMRFYAQRAMYLEQVVTGHTLESTYEQFLASLLATQPKALRPVQPAPIGQRQLGSHSDQPRRPRASTLTKQDAITPAQYINQDRRASVQHTLLPSGELVPVQTLARPPVPALSASATSLLSSTRC
ncbi:hypothetical protein CAOG_009595 [Capsaspora owczarzaki ATCC 30864]|uniref:Rap-GAP domain-containing protein n=2 Tax=Capsaspora owczarzaki (strain ATCC 30864) TaxID=595528 RepID=A0A0D2U9T8_CAPO3|nr:hypothetical protein CAOG_009595 [Capsaspora owczarzaki ATCC 30864]